MYIYILVVAKIFQLCDHIDYIISEPSNIS